MSASRERVAGPTGALRQRDVLDLIDAAYQPADGLEDWTQTLASAARPIIDQGFGVWCQLFDLHESEGFAFSFDGDDDELRRVLYEHDQHARPHPELLLPCPGATPLRRLSETAKQSVHLDTLRVFRDFGITDMLHLTVSDGSRYGATVAAPVGKELRAEPNQPLWAMVSVHLAAALRLQRRNVLLLDESADDVTVFDSRAEVVRASGASARPRKLAQLRDAARAIDRARGELRHHDQTLALEVWEGLVEGTWSIVDRHDDDGRRYIVAVPNEPEVRDPRGLTPREAQIAALAALGQSDKLIAYTLGLARSTVASHLRRALRKLGVQSRVELARNFTG